MYTNRLFIYPNQYISASDTSASYPKQDFRSYGEIKKFCEKFSTGRIPLIPDHYLGV